MVPEVAPRTVPDHAGKAMLATMTATATTSRNLSFRNIRPPLPGTNLRRSRQTVYSSLFHGESRRGIHRLLGKLVVHFDLDLVQARRQIGGRKRLLQRDLIPNIAHRVGRLDGMNDGL